MLGAAQFQVTFPDGHKLVYSGPVASGRSATAETREAPDCDTLILDSKYGDSRFHFPDQNGLESELLEWIAEEQNKDNIPVLLCSNPGKAQDLLQLLGNNGHIPRVHRSIFEFKRAYLALGVELPSCKQLRGAPESGEVVIWPIELQHSKILRGTSKLSFAALTGGSEPVLSERRFAWSARADFEGLTRYVNALNPQHVITVGAHASSFAKHLESLGQLTTSVLHDNPQLALI
jgi:putative mRNA 3-end processing factor